MFCQSLYVRNAKCTMPSHASSQHDTNKKPILSRHFHHVRDIFKYSFQLLILTFTELYHDEGSNRQSCSGIDV